MPCNHSGMVIRRILRSLPRRREALGFPDSADMFCRAMWDDDPEALAALGKHPLTDIRLSVARNRRTPLCVLADMAADTSAHVRATVASNPSCPTRTLELLARDDAPSVRSAVASNMAAPTQVRVLATL